MRPRGLAGVKADGTAKALGAEFGRLELNHAAAVLKAVARSALPGSIVRVFSKGTRDALLDLLPRFAIDELRDLRDDTAFRDWFERQLTPVAARILELNPPELRARVHPGYRWGHTTKVLAVYVRDVVLYSRYFTDAEARRIEPLLYCPIDGVVLARLRKLGVDPGVRLISGISSRERFYGIQELLRAAAARVNVPAIWFDDNWADREN
jgi:hypothetical protein